MKNSTHLFRLFILGILLAGCSPKGENTTPPEIFVQPLLSGEPTPRSIVLQARLTATDSLFFKDSIVAETVPGTPGMAQFELADNGDFEDALRSNWLAAKAETDFIVKAFFGQLKPGTDYFYRVRYGKDSTNALVSKPQRFATLPGAESEQPVSFVMVTGMHYYRFHQGGRGGGDSKDFKAASEKDSLLGFPGYEAILNQNPDFWIGNGDNVYYDHYYTGAADSLPAMRAHWHRLFSMPRFRNLLSVTPTFWLKDDHDHRYDDSDTTNQNKGKSRPKPSFELGSKTFLEQVPMVAPQSQNAKTYRTYRVNKDLQIWLVENRDYRSPNTMPDGENKSIWGLEQKQWLKQTLLKSTATFKILISPTPMIGPDDKTKIDNHTNLGGFRHERDEFFQWLKENDMLKKNFYIICGDRHWKYHSVHPTGVEEFSCGALVDANSRLGRLPGDPDSTDPDGKIQQPFTESEPSGGFLKVSVSGKKLTFSFFDEQENLLYEHTKTDKGAAAE